MYAGNHLKCLCIWHERLVIFLFGNEANQIDKEYIVLEHTVYSKMSSVINDEQTNQPAQNGGKVQCQECEKQFIIKGYLTSHHKSVHLGKKHACEKCRLKFTTKSNLTAHQKASHIGRKHTC